MIVEEKDIIMDCWYKTHTNESFNKTRARYYYFKSSRNGSAARANYIITETKEVHTSSCADLSQSNSSFKGSQYTLVDDSDEIQWLEECIGKKMYIEPINFIKQNSEPQLFF